MPWILRSTTGADIRQIRLTPRRPLDIAMDNDISCCTVIQLMKGATRWNEIHHDAADAGRSTRTDRGPMATAASGRAASRASALDDMALARCRAAGHDAATCRPRSWACSQNSRCMATRSSRSWRTAAEAHGRRDPARSTRPSRRWRSRASSRASRTAAAATFSLTDAGRTAMASPGHDREPMPWEQIAECIRPAPGPAPVDRRPLRRQRPDRAHRHSRPDREGGCLDRPGPQGALPAAGRIARAHRHRNH